MGKRARRGGLSLYRAKGERERESPLSGKTVLGMELYKG